MSSILLSNPFVTPTPASQPSSVEPQTGLAVAPTQGTSASSGAGDAAAFSGKGSGHGGSTGAEALIAKARANIGPTRPADATPGSVVSAQAEAEAPPAETAEPEFEMPDILPTAPWFKDND